jgi:hypothetical protein
MLNNDSATVFRAPKPATQPDMGEKDPGYLDTIKTASTVVHIKKNDTCDQTVTNEYQNHPAKKSGTRLVNTTNERLDSSDALLRESLRTSI